MVSKQSTKDVAPEFDWRTVTNLQDARAALGNVVNVADVLGDGSTFYDDKSLFVGKPFLILDWRFVVDEKSGREYVNVLIMGANGDKARFNDGSTGVYAQIKQIESEFGKVGVEVRGGLRRSDYVKEGVGEATTYYLAV
jgi:hypothetical protein